ncbi:MULTISPECIES: 50S ribosomal protein L24 [Carboxydocella]|uniref:Large ribosomal subunit protein uL24 n=2 Tax=Carboxydocella TaxID=178898 RepID=A0A1T4SAB8_9FIRM|nr:MULTISPECIES: 50S ribosomal protein L24 [Carboxydocella]AVX21796.1 LSU ribosomal protein L24P [Carboxydocella thermautotrophica]AVX32200.1 LSU ribosomal protein L24P [Carboxydocella thermautotrophica]SKA25152.1 LSU ribosomal protein L24P [Carboxydocella sporoproducens DSM 16521]GAW27572.1 50S ribosomal protein L24 [Carboxydocella sp. ULO1]GAW30920.1 50S ribosomal protein L24 [Carboxydocella sp. JDF658]
MSRVHVKKGDTVVVITGKDAGKKGKVLQVITDKNRVVVEGVNIVKRHTKPNQANPQGGIISKEAPIHASNVMLWCDKCGKGVRYGKLIKDGVKVRVCKKCGTNLE